ncbi:alpha-ketoglutarate-dependent dioxygenase AlkB [Aliterella atlantica]|uniref:alpha-ketoglutarate-dependent dioxygenase AlkB n=1 Tax=Aliterella atlantica TaxID=1827278 RepID=UPI000695AD2C|nr:alpha-ketoglutarate-dependent dioxygenase AlkB [Aliterella atlantica]
MHQTSLFPRAKQQLAPGAIHVPDWLNLERQQQLLDQCREWAKPPAGLYTPKMPDGKSLSVRVLCLGWHWYPYRYSKTRDDSDRLPCKAFPPQLADLAHRALQITLPKYKQFEPDVAIVNWYDSNAKLGIHQDRSESALVRNIGSPIISICFDLGITKTKALPIKISN